MAWLISYQLNSKQLMILKRLYSAFQSLFLKPKKQILKKHGCITDQAWQCFHLEITKIPQVHQNHEQCQTF